MKIFSLKGVFVASAVVLAAKAVVLRLRNKKPVEVTKSAPNERALFI